MICLFIYILFPSLIIKNVVTTKIQSLLNDANTGLQFQAETIRPYWLSGVQLKKIRVYNQYDTSNGLSIENLTVRVSFLPILFGNLSINTNIQLKDGEGRIDANLSLFDLFSNHVNLRDVQAEFRNFKLDGFFEQYMNYVTHGNNPGLAVLAPMIENTSFGGFLEGTVNYKDEDHFDSSFNLKLKNAYLDVNNITLNIPKQNFSVATINIQYQDSNMTIKKDTAFKAQNISLMADGLVKFDPKHQNKPNVNVKLGVLLSGQIDKNFSLFIPQLLKCPSSSMIEGSMKVNLVGPVNQMNCNP